MRRSHYGESVYAIWPQGIYSTGRQRSSSLVSAPSLFPRIVVFRATKTSRARFGIRLGGTIQRNYVASLWQSSAMGVLLLNCSLGLPKRLSQQFNSSALLSGSTSVQTATSVRSQNGCSGTSHWQIESTGSIFGRKRMRYTISMLQILQRT